MTNQVSRYFLHLSFNGTNYKGWQLQKNGNTVQAELNKALSLILRTDINVVGCGRTDTGVHAENYYAHFDLIESSYLRDDQRIIRKLNGILPNDIAIIKMFKVKNDAHARFSAISRTYEYRLSRVKNPFLHDFVFFDNRSYDMGLMNEGAKIIMTSSDFTSFSKLHTQTRTNECKIEQAIWKEKGELLVFTITADRFLRNMVRAIVGTLLDIGRQKIDLEQLKFIISSKNRTKAGMSVPAKGLFLIKVSYPDSIFL